MSIPKSGRKGQKGSSKRKASRSESVSASKRPRYRELHAGSLPWKRLPTRGYDFDDEGGVLELEEVDDVDIVWEELPDGGKRAAFRIREDRVLDEQTEQDAVSIDEEEWTGFAAESEADADNDEQGPTASTSKTRIPTPEAPQIAYDAEPFDDSLLPGFKDIPLLPSLKRALQSMKFSKPSAIQEKTLSEVIIDSAAGAKHRDIVGVAETGSGKTLAYSLPILQEIFTSKESLAGMKRPLSALILCPTRELALQVRQHLSDVIYRASAPPGHQAESEDSEGKKKHIPRANVVTICGGMSAQKQKRLLTSSHGVDIIVATPGRLWDMLEEDDDLGKAIKQMKFLVLDEADRMIENGHFAELDNIVGLTRRKGKKKAQEETAFEDDFENAASSLEATPVREDMITYVFSATMSKELQRNVKRKGRKQLLAEDEKGRMGALGDLISKLDFRDDDALVIDLTTAGGVVASLQEVRIDCLLKEKDVYLYYFLLRYPGRTLVFLSSIDAIRRLKPLLEILNVNVAVLHSGMQQRARLKALERFKDATSMVLLATDVAARGLDVPAVEHVVHYQLPRTADTYIHRSGRTARAGNQGLALQLCAPEEKGVQRALMKSLGKSEPSEQPCSKYADSSPDEKLKELPVEYSILTKLRERVELARQIETAQHRAEKASHDENWLKKAAEEMEIDLDPDDDEDSRPSKRKSKAAKGQERALRERLQALLAQPLMLRGISSRYITSGTSNTFAKDMLSGNSHMAMLGLPRSRAVDDVR